MSAVSVTVLTVFLWAADREVETTLLRAGGGRAQAAADQLAGLLSRSTQQRLDELTRASADATVRQFLLAQTPETLDAARQRLAALAAAAPQTIELWNSTGERLMKIDSPPAAPPWPMPLGSITSSRGVGPLQVSGEMVFYDIAADVNADDSRTTAGQTPHRVGWLVVRRPLIATPADALSRIVGGDALITIGNRANSVWTDLTRVVPRPPVDVSQNQTAEYRGQDGETRMGAAARISRTPWAVWVEFPRAAILAPARTFFQRLIGIGGLLLAFGWLGAYVLSRRITTPLSALVAATSGIAAGDYSQRVATDREDEIGQLGRSFNTMTAEVETMHWNLEARVDARTRDLDEALAQLNQRSEAQQAQLAAIVASSDDGIIGKTLDGVIQTWNAGAERLYGYAVDEVVGRSVSILIPPDRPDDLPDILKRLAAGEHIRHYEAVRVKKDGTRLQVSLTMSPIADRSGHIVGAATVARDMTERKRLEDQLRQAQKMEAVGRLAGGGGSRFQQSAHRDSGIHQFDA
jgi:PAS domain S-box-containing protein